MTTCAQAAFPTKIEAQRAKRTLARRRQVHTYGYLCDDCQKYHLGLKGALFRPNEIELVRRMAQGLTIPEIARNGDMGGTEFSLNERIKRMKERLYATSAVNLAVILVALGAIDTREIILPYGEHNV